MFARIVDSILEHEVTANRLTHPDDIAIAREVIEGHVAATLAYLDDHRECQRWVDDGKPIPNASASTTDALHLSFSGEHPPLNDHPLTVSNLTTKPA